MLLFSHNTHIYAAAATIRKKNFADLMSTEFTTISVNQSVKI